MSVACGKDAADRERETRKGVEERSIRTDAITARRWELDVRLRRVEKDVTERKRTPGRARDSCAELIKKQAAVESDGEPNAAAGR